MSGTGRPRPVAAVEAASSASSATTRARLFAARESPGRGSSRARPSFGSVRPSVAAKEKEQGDQDLVADLRAPAGARSTSAEPSSTTASAEAKRSMKLSEKLEIEFELRLKNELRRLFAQSVTCAMRVWPVDKGLLNMMIKAALRELRLHNPGVDITEAVAEGRPIAIERPPRPPRRGRKTQADKPRDSRRRKNKRGRQDGDEDGALDSDLDERAATPPVDADRFPKGLPDAWAEDDTQAADVDVVRLSGAKNGRGKQRYAVRDRLTGRVSESVALADNADEDDAELEHGSSDDERHATAADRDFIAPSDPDEPEEAEQKTDMDGSLPAAAATGAIPGDAPATQPNSRPSPRPPSVGLPQSQSPRRNSRPSPFPTAGAFRPLKRLRRTVE